MITCPKCGKELEDGAKFCEGCGAQISAGVFCPSCGAENSPEFAFCQTCGASMTAEAAAPAAPAQKKPNPLAGIIEKVKQLPKKVWMYAGIGVAAVVAIIVVVSLLAGGGSKKPNAALYIKGNEIVYNTMAKKAEPIELTEKLLTASNILGTNLSTVGNRMGQYVRFNKDGSRIFYPDRISSDGVTLYYKSTKKLSAEGEKIDSGVQYYMINEAGTKVMYQKDGSLYLSDLKDKEKIASDVSGINVSKDLSKVIFTVRDEKTNTSAVYLWKSGSDKEKLASDVKSLSYVDENLSVIYYTKDDGTEEEPETSLYKQEVGKEEKEKIAEGIAQLIKVYDSGEIYYTKAVKTEKVLMDYVEDDMAVGDAALTEPKAPEYPTKGTYPQREAYPKKEAYPTKPSKPYRYQFTGETAQADYEAAYEQYEADLEAYNKKVQEIDDAYAAEKKRIDDEYAAARKKVDDEYTAAKEAYNTAYAEYKDVLRPAWNEKKNRDNLRENLAEAKLNTTAYTLYCYNGKESVSVTETMTGSYAVEYALDKAVLIVETAKAAQVEKIKLSTVEGTYDVREKVNKALDTEKEMTLVAGTTLSKIEQENATQFNIANDGSVLYFLDDVDGEKKIGDLYKVAVSDGKAGNKEKLDSDVYNGYIYIVWDNAISYAKDVKSENDKGDLYVDGQSIDIDVYLYSVDDSDNKTLRYYTDYKAEKKEGTLKQCVNSKEPVTIADDVFNYTVLPNGDLLYLSDYNINRYRGTLFRYAGGKATQLDEDVTAIVPVYWSK